MGSSQSKATKKNSNSIKGRRRLEENSILAAIAANKRQRNQLMKQVKRANANSQHHLNQLGSNYAPPAHRLHPQQTTTTTPYYDMPMVSYQQHQQFDYMQNGQLDYALPYHYQYRSTDEGLDLVNDDDDDSLVDENLSSAVTEALGGAGGVSGDTPQSVALSSSASSFLNHPVYLPPPPPPGPLHQQQLHLAHAPPTKRLAKVKASKQSTRPLIASNHQNLSYANGVGGGVPYMHDGVAVAPASASASGRTSVASQASKKQRRLQQQQQQKLKQLQLQPQQPQRIDYNHHLPPVDSPPPPTSSPLMQLAPVQRQRRAPQKQRQPQASSHHNQHEPLQLQTQLDPEQSSSPSSPTSSSSPPLPQQPPPPPSQQQTQAALLSPLNAVRGQRGFKQTELHILQQATDPFGHNKPSAKTSKGKTKLQQMSSEQKQQTPNGGDQPSASQLERGLALGYDERRRQNLLGLLPAAIQDQELQIKVVVNYIEQCKDELSKYVYLRNLKDFNENLFYAALSRHVEKLMPIVYTPTVGLACQKFSEIYMRPRGLFISAREAGQVSEVLANWPRRDVLVIVVTDGERILGLGDLGANGMGISIGKLSLYTALAGISPQNVLPVTIDVGTNNETYLKDPLYIGLRQERVRGAKYDELIEEFMRAVVERFGRTCLIQFEDFANSNAFGLLQRYRRHYCTFNDDIQGTASVCLSGLISAARLIGRRLADCSFLFYGAGEANLGTAQLLVMAMTEEGATQAEAKAHIWLVDSKGLVVSSRTDLSDHKRHFAQEAPHLRTLEEIIEHTKPLGIVGASAQGGAFTESICKKMAEYNERPIIFALSNPTSKAECTADQAYRWTEGRCVFASGSPFEPVAYNGRTYVTGQGNNAYIFPAVGLASIAARIHTIPEETFLVAARALSDQLTPSDSSQGLVYPSLSKIKEVTLRVATRVLEHFYSERLATYRPEPNDKLAFLKGIQYDYRYR